MTCGIIALDIDGTIVHRHEPLSLHIVECLTDLANDGWVLLFATGRTVRWSLEHLRVLPFSFLLAPYNGACLYSVPDQKMVHSTFLTREQLFELDSLVMPHGAVIYEAGGEERIFYTEGAFSLPVALHLKTRQQAQKERWEVISTFADLPAINIASLRCFLHPEEALLLSRSIMAKTVFHAPMMKDSFWDALRIVQVTSGSASKGRALSKVQSMFPGFPSIAAGDDHNDIDLLLRADVGISFATAPDEVKRVASIIASGGPESITEALSTAVMMVKRYGPASL